MTQPQEELIAALRNQAAYPHDTGRIDLVETHISWVLLTGQYAYKIKKPVSFPFLDFSTLALRKRYCDDELALNRRLAPELYLDVVPIGGTLADPRVGALPAIEYAVKMVQFPTEHTLDELLEGDHVPPRAFLDLADRIATFHASLEPTDATPIEHAARENLAELAGALDPHTRARVGPLESWTKMQSQRLARRFRQREAGGAIRECHGDLHLGNLAWIDDRIVPFDCLEFDRTLRCVDTLDEVAFLTMDLMAHDRSALAHEFLSRYLEDTGDYGGVDLLRYYLVYRALVRCKVRRLSAAQHAGATPTPGPLPYLDLAERLIAPVRPLLLITRGLSGSGKTTVTSGLVPALRAIRVRSDLERKRLHGLRASEHSHSRIGQDLYSEAASNATYAALADAAATALDGRLDILVDAAFLDRSRRAAFAAIAERHDASFVILDCVTSEDELRARVCAREAQGRDASEAGLTVLEHQIAHHEPITGTENAVTITVDTTGPVNADALARKVAALRR